VVAEGCRERYWREQQHDGGASWRRRRRRRRREGERERSASRDVGGSHVAFASCIIRRYYFCCGIDYTDNALVWV
jgi:hypothetical protein